MAAWQTSDSAQPKNLKRPTVVKFAFTKNPNGSRHAPNVFQSESIIWLGRLRADSPTHTNIPNDADDSQSLRNLSPGAINYLFSFFYLLLWDCWCDHLDRSNKPAPATMTESNRANAKRENGQKHQLHLHMLLVVAVVVIDDVAHVVRSHQRSKVKSNLIYSNIVHFRVNNYAFINLYSISENLFICIG